MTISEIDRLLRASKRVLLNDGVKVFLAKSLFYVDHRVKSYFSRMLLNSHCKDILFINGCMLPHPSRYRISHQIEQLHFCGFSCDEIWYELLKFERLNLYRGFVFFRCPSTPLILEFINKARQLNKLVAYDIDDLMMDESYVKGIKYLKTLTQEELSLYMSGIRRNKETLQVCDAAITTTTVLANELRKFCPTVFINRNVASEAMVKLSLDTMKMVTNKPDQVTLGYFSGSITHNPDFELISSVIKRIMREKPHVILLVVGILSIPEDLKEFGKRIIVEPFRPWSELPEIIKKCDINLVPLEKTLFNEAKSENKWVEASLVKVPTVASKVGPFADMIIDGKTGILCDTEDEWYSKLNELINDSAKRRIIADYAHNEVIKNNVTAYTGKKLANFISGHMSPSIAFVLPTTNVSGGVNVLLKHAIILRKHGADVLVIALTKEPPKTIVFEGEELYIASPASTGIHRYFDIIVASLWSTCSWIMSYPKAKRKVYLVQNFETDFYEFGHPWRTIANYTYNAYPNFEYLTISKWCQEWLEKTFNNKADFIRNGLNREVFSSIERNFSGIIRILIEGDCGSHYKNIDEAFKITNTLDRSRYEIWYLSNNSHPKSWYLLDKFYHKVPYDKVADIYKSCHILLKTSLLESFSYPPLEMMSTGGIVVAVLNDGNREYLVPEHNCLTYPQGQIDSGRDMIERISRDENLRLRLITNGIETAKNRDWNVVEADILNFYLGKQQEKFICNNEAALLKE